MDKKIRGGQTRIKPVYLINQEGLIDLEKQAVLDGVSELIRLADVSNVELVDFGVWRNKDYKNLDDSLREYQSVDWYIEEGKRTSMDRRQVNAEAILFTFHGEPWRYPENGGNDHYDLLVVHEDIYAGDNDFIIGLGIEGIGTVISTRRFFGVNNKARYECIKTETMHEMGHVFGLLPEERTENVKNLLGKHCANKCVMRQGLQVPDDWILMSHHLIQHGALCSTCRDDLREYFR